MGSKNKKKEVTFFRKRRTKKHDGMFGQRKLLENKAQAGDEEATAVLQKFSTEPHDYEVSGFTSDDPCIICQQKLKNESSELVKENALIALLQCSIERGDNLSSTLESLSEIVVHTQCRKDYMKQANIKAFKIQKQLSLVEENLADALDPELEIRGGKVKKSFLEDNFLAKAVIESKQYYLGLKACIFCKKNLSFGDVVTTNAEYVERLRKLSLIAKDDLHKKLENLVEIDVHDNCLKKYEKDAFMPTVPAYIEHVEENAPFDFKVQCLLCKKDASDEFVKLEGKKPANKQVLVCEVNEKSEKRITEAVKNYPGVWSSQVLHRVKRLEEQKVVTFSRYHSTCFFTFCFNRQKDFVPDTSPIIKAKTPAYPKPSKCEKSAKIKKQIAVIPVEKREEFEFPAPSTSRGLEGLIVSDNITTAAASQNLEDFGETSQTSEHFNITKSTHFADDDDSSGEEESTHFADDDDSSGEEDPALEEPDFLCNSCNKGIPKIRYSCVHCPDFDLCCACAATGEHSLHYMLRVPEGRPKREVERVLQHLRLNLADPAPNLREPPRMPKVIPAKASDDAYHAKANADPCLQVLDELKVEVKEEVEDSLDPLEGAVPDIDRDVPEYDIEITRLVPVAPPAMRLASLNKTLQAIALPIPTTLLPKLPVGPKLPVATHPKPTPNIPQNPVRSESVRPLKTHTVKRKTTPSDKNYFKKLKLEKNNSRDTATANISIDNANITKEVNKEKHGDKDRQEDRQEIVENEELQLALQNLSQIYAEERDERSTCSVQGENEELQFALQNLSQIDAEERDERSTCSVQVANQSRDQMEDIEELT